MVRARRPSGPPATMWRSSSPMVPAMCCCRSRGPSACTPVPPPWTRCDDRRAHGHRAAADGPAYGGGPSRPGLDDRDGRRGHRRRPARRGGALELPGERPQWRPRVPGLFRSHRGQHHDLTTPAGPPPDVPACAGCPGEEPVPAGHSFRFSLLILPPGLSAPVGHRRPLGETESVCTTANRVGWEVYWDVSRTAAQTVSHEIGGDAAARWRAAMLRSRSWAIGTLPWRRPGIVRLPPARQ